MVLPALAMAVFALTHDPLGLVVLLVVGRVSIPFQEIAWHRASYDAMDDAPGGWRRTYHLQVERELVLAVARTLSFGIGVLVFSSGNSLDAAQHLMLVLAAGPIVVGLCQQRLNRYLAGAAPMAGANDDRGTRGDEAAALDAAYRAA
jgi:hypothetical protein